MRSTPLSLPARLAYGERNRLLLSMGFGSYQEYLRSPLWQGIRRAVLHGRPACVRCGGRSALAHHVRYTRENLSGRSMDGLVPMCWDCHREIEFGPDGAKRSPREAELAASKKSPHKRKKKRDRDACVCCGVNRPYDGGPCVPCRKKARERGEPPAEEKSVYYWRPKK